MKQGFLIYNPSAGQRQKSPEILSKVVRQFDQYNINITPSPTQPDLSVLGQVRELLIHQPDLIVAWGGDGTINEVVNGMFGSRIPLGIIPGGTANLLARELSIPLRLSGAIRIIGKGNTRAISVGQANKRYFLLMVGIGFDSEVIKNVDWNLKKKIGTLAFAAAALKAARQYSFEPFTIRAEGIDHKAVFAVICNGKEYGAYFKLAPRADITDDYFYVCLFKEPGMASMARYFISALTSQHHRLKSVEIFRATSVEAIGSNRIPVQADGEFIGYLPVKFQILPRSLQVFAP